MLLKTLWLTIVTLMICWIYIYYFQEFGIFGKKNGWTFILGGSSARRPRIGDMLTEDLAKEEVIDLTKRCLEYYKDRAKKKERMARFVDRIGIENVKEALL
jgi:NAD(P)H-nitrite reductase large subunit